MSPTCLAMAYIRIYEIATFYTMFNLAPVGRHYVQVCGTTPCWLRGADEIKDTCRRLIGAPGQVTADGLSPGPRSSASAPASTRRWLRSTRTITKTSRRRAWKRSLRDLKAGRPVTPGPQNGRQASAPLGGPITLTDPELYKQ